MEGKKEPIRFINVPNRQTLPFSRGELNKMLREKLINSQEHAIYLHGNACVGKTTLVIQCLHEQLNNLNARFSHIVWIDCSDITAISTQLITIAEKLGHETKNFDEARQKIVEFFSSHEHSNLLLVLDSFNDESLDYLSKQSVISLITEGNKDNRLLCISEYPVNYSTFNQLSLSVSAPVEIKPLSRYEAESLIKSSLTLLNSGISEKWKLSEEFYQFMQGLPGFIVYLTNEYNTNAKVNLTQTFNEYCAFMAKQPKAFSSPLKSSIESKLNKLAKSSSHDMNRAAVIVKASSYLGDHPIPYQFFQHDNETDFQAIGELSNMGLIELHRKENSFTLSPHYRTAIREIVHDDKDQYVWENIRRIANIFEYLTINADKKEPRDFIHIVPHVSYITRSELVLPSDAECQNALLESIDPNNMIILTKLWSSLGRFYLMYMRDLQLAKNCLEQADRFIKSFLEFTITQKKFEVYLKSHKKFKAEIADRVKEVEEDLLCLYGREILYQLGSIASRQNSRAHFKGELVDFLKNSYHLQQNTKSNEKKARSIAFTLRSLSRALRKSNKKDEAVEYLKKLEKRWIKQIQIDAEKKDLLEAQLLVDHGIIEKELQDENRKQERNGDYSRAIELLQQTEAVYQAHNCYNDLAMLSIYLGEAHVAAGELIKGVLHYLTIFYYERKAGRELSQQTSFQSRAYFNLARDLYGADGHTSYMGLAYFFAVQALICQRKNYGDEHDYVKETQNLERSILKEILSKNLGEGNDKTPTQYPQKFSFLSKEELTNQKVITDLLGVLIEDIEKKTFSDDVKTFETVLTQVDCLLLDRLTTSEERKRISNRHRELDSISEGLESQEALQEEKAKLRQKEQETWYRHFSNKISLNPRSYLFRFSQLFENALLNKLMKKLKRAMGLKTTDKTKVAAGISRALANFLPTIEANESGEVKAKIDFSKVAREIIDTVGEHHENRLADESHQVEQAHSKESELIKSVRENAKVMAEYVARCYSQPINALLEGLAWKKAIAALEKLAEAMAKRVVNYQKTGQYITNTSQREVAIVALLHGNGNKVLRSYKFKDRQWKAERLIKEPGIKIYGEKEVYVIDRKRCHPEWFRFRYASAYEVEMGNYEKFDNEEAAMKACLGDDYNPSGNSNSNN